MVEIVQPPIPRGPTPGRPNYVRGAQRSVTRLAQLGYDPIGELVKKYRELEKEILRQEKIRSGEVVELTSTGKTRAYRAEIHQTLYDKQINIAKELLRYGYGRVPEVNIVDDNRTPSFVVNLTAPGKQYVVSAPEEPQQLEPEEEDFQIVDGVPK